MRKQINIVSLFTLILICLTADLVKGDEYVIDSLAYNITRGRDTNTILPAINNGTLLGCQGQPGCEISMYYLNPWAVWNCQKGTCNTTFTFHSPATDQGGSAMVYLGGYFPSLFPGSAVEGYGIQLSLYDDDYRTPRLEFIMPSGEIFKSNFTLDVSSDLDVEIKMVVTGGIIKSITIEYEGHKEFFNVQMYYMNYGAQGVHFATEDTKVNNITITGLQFNEVNITELRTVDLPNIYGTQKIGEFVDLDTLEVDDDYFTSYFSSPNASFLFEVGTIKSVINPRNGIVAFSKVIPSGNMISEFSFDLQEFYSTGSDGYFRLVFGEYSAEADGNRTSIQSNPTNECETQFCLVYQYQRLYTVIQGTSHEVYLGTASSINSVARIHRIHLKFDASSGLPPSVYIGVNDATVYQTQFSGTSDITNGNPYISFEFKGGQAGFRISDLSIVFRDAELLHVADLTPSGTPDVTAYQDSFVLLDGTDVYGNGSMRILSTDDYHVQGFAFEYFKSFLPVQPGGQLYLHLGSSEDYDGMSTDGLYIPFNTSYVYPPQNMVRGHLPMMPEYGSNIYKYRSWSQVYVKYVNDGASTEVIHSVDGVKHTIPIYFPVALNKTYTIYGLEYRAEGEVSYLKIRNFRYWDDNKVIKYVDNAPVQIVTGILSRRDSSSMFAPDRIITPLLTDPRPFLFGANSSNNATSEINNVNIKKLTTFVTDEEFYIVGEADSHLETDTTNSYVRVISQEPFFQTGNLTFDTMLGGAYRPYDMYYTYGSMDVLTNSSMYGNLSTSLVLGDLTLLHCEYLGVVLNVLSSTVLEVYPDVGSQYNPVTFELVMTENSTFLSASGSIDVNLTAPFTYSDFTPDGHWAFILTKFMRAALITFPKLDVIVSEETTVTSTVMVTSDLYPTATVTETITEYATLTDSATQIATSTINTETSVTVGVTQTVGEYFLSQVTDVVTSTYNIVVATVVEISVETVTVDYKPPSKPNIVAVAVGGSVGAAAAVAGLAFVMKSNIFNKAIEAKTTGPAINGDATLNNPLYNDPTQFQESEIYDVDDTLSIRSFYENLA